MSVFGGVGLTGAQVAARLHPGYPAGGQAWMVEGPSAAGAIPAVDVLYLYPFRVYSPIVVNLIVARTATGGAGSAIKCAVWRNNFTTARPVGLPILGQNAGFDTTTTGNDTAAIANIALAPGVYWGGSKATGTLPQMLAVSSPSVQISTAAIATGTPFIGFSAPDAYANDIMATDLTSGTFTGVSSTSIPAIGLGWV